MIVRTVLRSSVLVSLLSATVLLSACGGGGSGSGGSGASNSGTPSGGGSSGAGAGNSNTGTGSGAGSGTGSGSGGTGGSAGGSGSGSGGTGGSAAGSGSGGGAGSGGGSGSGGAGSGSGSTGSGSAGASALTCSGGPAAGSGTGGASGSLGITAQPAPQTVTVGQHALFCVTATGASSYQWAKNGTPITGTNANANGPVYYTPAITAADEGSAYSVTVTDSHGSTTTSTGAALHVNPNADGSPPAAANFWGATPPAATQVMTLSFVNRTNGKYPDSQVFWSFSGTTDTGVAVKETHSIQDMPIYDMPAVKSARMYFYIAPDVTKIGQGDTNYFDFIEFNIGRSSTAVPYNFNGDTTRVDAFGLKTAIHLHCNDTNQTDLARGEDYGAFLEDRGITFQKYLAETPPEFQASGTQWAPYRIKEPGASGFGPTGPNANYDQAYIDQVWAANNIDPTQVPKPTPYLNFVSNQQPDLSAAMERHVADQPGTFNASGKLANPNFWRTIPSSQFYASGPANFYARFWHTHGIAGLAYGFPYDDVGGYSSDIGCNSPQYLVVAIGW